MVTPLLQVRFASGHIFRHSPAKLTVLDDTVISRISDSHDRHHTAWFSVDEVGRGLSYTRRGMMHDALMMART